MAVNLTFSRTLDGAAVSDALAGGGTGLDLGSCVNGSYCPVIDRPSNTGREDIYISHDAVVDPITSAKIYIEQFGTNTGFTYGGADSAANDYAALKLMGQNSGVSQNNADGNSEGLWIDMDADISDANQFSGVGGARATVAKIFGDNGTDGIDEASAFTLAADAMVYENAGEQLASAAVAGSIGKAGDTVLGDSAHIRLRAYLKDSQTQGGIYQWEYVISYTHTA
jgi:hypothetical protein